jgi:hypothetical protein
VVSPTSSSWIMWKPISGVASPQKGAMHSPLERSPLCFDADETSHVQSPSPLSLDSDSIANQTTCLY